MPHILFVDDIAADVELAEIALANAGILFVSVRECCEQEFVERLTHHPPDVIVSDLSLPGFDGLAALKIARSLVPGVPFIVHSGWIDDERLRAARSLGALGCADKDRPGELVHLVREALASLAAKPRCESVE